MERQKLTVIEAIYSSLSYTPALKDHYTAFVVNVRLIEIANKIILSHLLTTSSRAIYTLYITIDNMTVKLEAILTLLANLAKDATVSKTLDITLIDELSLQILFEKKYFTEFKPRIKSSGKSTILSPSLQILFSTRPKFSMKNLVFVTRDMQRTSS